MIRKGLLALSGAALIALFAGCGGGGSSGSTTTSLFGTVVEDLVLNGVVKVYRPDTNATLATGRTDKDGHYTLNLPSGYTGPVVVSVTGDENTTMKDINGTISAYPSGLQLRSVANVGTADNGKEVHVSMLSEMAAAIALKPGNENNMTAAINDALYKIQSGQLTAGVPVDLSKDPSDINASPVETRVLEQIRTTAQNSGDVTQYMTNVATALRTGQTDASELSDLLDAIQNSGDDMLESLDDDAMTTITLTPPENPNYSASGITAAKTMFGELRTQVLLLSNPEKNGFFDVKADKFAQAAATVVAPDGELAISMASLLLNGIAYLESNLTTNTALLSAIDPYVYSHVYNGTDHSITLTKTGTNSYTYTFDGNSSLSGAFSATPGTAISVSSVSLDGYYPSNQTPGARDHMKVTGTATDSNNGATTTIALSGLVASNDVSYELTNLSGKIYTTAGGTYGELTQMAGNVTFTDFVMTGTFNFSGYMTNASVLDNNGYIPATASFSGKITDTTDSTYIDGYLEATIQNPAENMNTWRFTASLTGKIQMKDRPLMKLVVTYQDSATVSNEAAVSVQYTYGTTQLNGTGTIYKDTPSTEGYRFVATVTNQAGVATRFTQDNNDIWKGTVTQNGLPVGIIDMMSSVPRVKYDDGTFESLV